MEAVLGCRECVALEDGPRPEEQQQGSWWGPWTVPSFHSIHQSQSTSEPPGAVDLKCPGGAAARKPLRVSCDLISMWGQIP